MGRATGALGCRSAPRTTHVAQGQRACKCALQVTSPHQYERQPRFVQDAAGLHHVAHERLWIDTASGVYHVDDGCWKRRRQDVRDDVAGGRPRKDLDLARCVHQYGLQGSLTRLLQQLHDLVEASGEEVAGGEDAPVRTQLVLLHDVFVVHLHWLGR